MKIKMLKELNPQEMENKNLMLYHLCSTSKSKWLKTIDYKSSDGKRWLNVSANHEYGMVKIWDFDILRFALSRAGEVERITGYFPNSIEFTADDYFGFIGCSERKNYKWLKDALLRLCSTIYSGNIFEGDEKKIKFFRLITFSYMKINHHIEISFDERLVRDSLRYSIGLPAIEKEVLQEDFAIKSRLLELLKVSKTKDDKWDFWLIKLKEIAHKEGLDKFKRLISNYDLPWKLKITKTTSPKETIVIH
jgi:hypothetical protein